MVGGGREGICLVVNGSWLVNEEDEGKRGRRPSRVTVITSHPKLFHIISEFYSYLIVFLYIVDYNNIL